MKIKSNISRLFFLIAIVTMSIYSCQKDDPIVNKKEPIAMDPKDTVPDSENPVLEIESVEEQNERIAKTITKGQVQTDVVVKVVNNQDMAQSNALVRLSGKEVMTNERGLAIFQKMVLNKDHVLVTVSKDGFERALKTVTPSEKSITNINVMLLNDVPELTMDTSSGGQLETQDVKLLFPPNAVVDESGIEFKGQAVVNVKYFNMRDEDDIRAQPGTLIGITDSNEEVGLVSEGMLTVDISDGNGNVLQLGSDKKVSVSMPASSDGPDTIALWHLNETYGLWVEMGEAVKNGNVYEFEVSHFSSYNLDFPLDDSINFCIDITYENGNPAGNQFFKIFYQNERGETLYRCLSTNEFGVLCILRGLPGKYTIGDNQCSQFTKTEIDVPKSGFHKVVLDIKDDRTYLSLTGGLNNCDGEPDVDQLFSFYVDNVPNENVTELFVGRTDMAGKFSIYKTLCGNYDAIENATLSVTGTSGTRTNNFPIDLSKEHTDIDLNTCGPIEAFSETDVLTLDDCLKFWVLPRREREGSKAIIYYDVKNMTELGSSCNDFINCLDFTNLQQLYYFTSLETLAFSIPNDQTEFDFTPLANLKNLKKIIIIGTEDEYLQILGELRNLLPDVEIEFVINCVIQ